MPKYTNSENEVVSIQKLGWGPFEGQHILVIHDDPPPLGSGAEAPMLLDEGTRKWLQRQLKIMEEEQLLSECEDPQCSEWHRELIETLKQEV